MDIPEWNPRNTAAVSVSNYSENSQTETMEALEPTRAHRACITELSLRFPCARDTDPDAYRIRLEYLANDTAHLAVPLLRKACQRVSQSARGLPYASEIITAAADIVNERAEVEKRDKPSIPNAPNADNREAAFYHGNTLALAKGMRLMMTGKGDLFKLGDKGERRGVRSDGTVIEPWFHSAAPGDTIPSGWYCKREDAHALADCYDAYRAAFRMAGAMIVEIAGDIAHNAAKGY